MPPTFSTHFLLYILKSVSGQMMINYGGSREYFFYKIMRSERQHLSIVLLFHCRGSKPSIFAVKHSTKCHQINLTVVLFHIHD